MNEIHLPAAKPGDVIISPAGHRWTLKMAHPTDRGDVRLFTIGDNEAIVRTDGSRIPAWTERVERDGVTIWPRTEDQ